MLRIPLIHNKGFTLVEVIMVIVIVAVLAVSGAWIMSYVVQNSIFLPNQLGVEMVLSDTFDIMIEGDSQAKGLRFLREIRDIGNNDIDFNNQDGQRIRFRYRTQTDRVQRRIGNGAWEDIPYYVASNMTISRDDSNLFSYFDAGENTTNDENNVRRIEMTLIATTGSGAFNEWQGRSQQTTAIAVKKFNDNF